MQSFCHVTGLLLALLAVLPAVVTAASTASLRGATTTTPEHAILTEELQSTASSETPNNENGPHEDSDNSNLLPASSRALQQRFGGRFSNSGGNGNGGYYPTTSSSSSSTNTNNYPYTNTVGTGYTGYFAAATGGGYGSGFGAQLQQQYYNQGDYGPGSNSLNFYDQRPTTGTNWNNYYEDNEGDYYYDDYEFDDYDFDYYDDYDFDDYDYYYDSPETRPCPATQVYCPAFEDCIPEGYCPTGGNNGNGNGNTNNNNQNFSTGTLVAQIATLEDKMGPISGQVQIVFEADGNFQFQYELQGIEATCVNCGVHIHDGTSCATDGGEHYWDQETMGFMDVWTVPNGAYYQGAPSGRATGSYTLYNGFGAEENRGRAVIVHGSDGSRIGCGILN